MSKKYVNGELVDLTTDEIAEIETQKSNSSASEASVGYKRKRIYPPVTDQLDMLWHSIDAGEDLKLSEFYTGNKAIKDTFPKP